ncbi:MAG: hypothetical protein FJ312_00215 [SAR202 cluster bacterium]|nr:hypothetical protein [SAR202 cluster bacterium]
MSEFTLPASKDEIASSLQKRAVALWGEKRAREAQKTIDEAAGYITQIANDPMPVEEAPAGYP